MSGNSKGHSTLEMLEHDSSANAPELDQHQPGLELNLASQVRPDRDMNAPQLAYASGLERTYDDQPPIPVKELDEKYGAIESPARAPRASKKAFWIYGCIACVVIIATAVGVGVGVTRSRNALSSSPNTTTQPASVSPTQISASPPAQTSTTFLPTSKNSMTNRTAVASLVRDNGERHVFFQEESGIIRESINKANSWTAPIDYVVATDARNNTPLAAFHIPKSTNVSADITIETLHLFYIHTNNTIAVRSFTYDVWESDAFAVLGNDSLPIAVSSNSTSLDAVITQESSASPYSLYLFYEGVDGSEKALYGTSPKYFAWVWKDQGLDGIETALPNAKIRKPISGCAESGDRRVLVSATVQNTRGQLSSQSWIWDEGRLNLTPSSMRGSIDDTFLDSDITCTFVYSPSSGTGPTRYAYWVNGTRLDIFGAFGASESETVPQYEFPYKRITSVTPTNSTLLYVYHQVNESAIGEHVFDQSTGHWLSSNIGIATG